VAARIIARRKLHDFLFKTAITIAIRHNKTDDA